MSIAPTRVLFVCLGNICRSPLAEAVFRDQVRQRGVADQFEIDSAGTSDWHQGHPPDERTRSVALERGLEVGGTSRPVTPDDLGRWDLIVAMDGDNLAALDALHARFGRDTRIHRLREWDPEPGTGDVPDPYLAGHRDGFHQVHDIVERSCERLLDDLLAERESRT